MQGVPVTILSFPDPESNAGLLVAARRYGTMVQVQLTLLRQLVADAKLAQGVGVPTQISTVFHVQLKLDLQVAAAANSEHGVGFPLQPRSTVEEHPGKNAHPEVVPLMDSQDRSLSVKHEP